MNRHDQAHMLMAKAAAIQSKDTNTKVGCVLVSPDRRHIVYGYNGFPCQFVDDERVYARKILYESGTLSKDDIVVHAEMNAILNCDVRPEGYTLYCTHRPCVACAKHIAAAGIARVVCCADEPTTEMGCDKAEELLRIAGITYERIQP